MPGEADCSSPTRSVARCSPLRRVENRSPTRHFGNAFPYPASLRSEAFVQDPFAARFAPVHRVGESFAARPAAEERIPLDEVTAASTLRLLATHVFHLPVSGFERLNPGIEPHQPLDAGAEVAVPDARFAPLLAARFAAEAMSNPGIADDERVRILSTLVPIAVINATALDTVLTRLVLGAARLSLDELDRILEVAPPWETEDAAPVGEPELTRLAGAW